jgi:hypothetical protein
MDGVSGEPVTAVTGQMTVYASRDTNGERVDGSSGPDSSYCTYDTEPIQGTLTVDRDNGPSLPVDPEAALPGTYRATLFYAQHFTWTLRDNDGETLVKEWALPPLFTVTASETADGVMVSWSPPDVPGDGFGALLQVRTPSGQVLPGYDAYVRGGSKLFPAAQFSEVGTYSISLTREPTDRASSTPEFVSLSISTTFTRP